MTSATGRIESIQVGTPKKLVMPDGVRVDFENPFWTSAIFKHKITGPASVTSNGIGGDQQADLENHGGPDNVVLAYDASHYPDWLEQLAGDVDELPYGSFGENFTVSGFTDDQVCIGDIWDIGPDHGLKLQITQARQPCFKLARRLRLPQIVKLVIESGWGGLGIRVLRDGPAEAGMEIHLTERIHPEWTVAKAVQTMYARKRHPQNARLLASLPELSARWKRELIIEESAEQLPDES